MHEEVADWFRKLSTGRKPSLAGGIARAQALLALPGVLGVAIAAEAAEAETSNAELKTSLQRGSSRRPPPPIQAAPALDDDDNPFGPTAPSPVRQAAPEDVRGAQVDEAAARPLRERAPHLDDETEAVEPIERDLHSGEAAPAPLTEPPPDDTLSKTYRELNSPKSTADGTETTPTEHIDGDPFQEPQF